MGAASRRADGPAAATATSARPARVAAGSTWSRWSTTSRPATRRRCSSRPPACSASAPRPRATAASPSSRSWAGTPATSPWAPPTASRTSLLVPEHPLNVDALVERVDGDLRPAEARRHRLRRGGRRRARARSWGPSRLDRPGRQQVLSGAAEALRQMLIERLGDSYFTSKRRNESAKAAIFTRKVGHTQRGGRPILLRPLLRARSSAATPWTCCWKARSTRVADPAVEPRAAASTSTSVHANDFRDRWGLIHARQMHPSFYDPSGCSRRRPASTTCCRSSRDAIGADDLEALRPRAVPPRQPDAAVPLGQHRRQQAHQVSRRMICRTISTRFKHDQNRSTLDQDYLCVAGTGEPLNSLPVFHRAWIGRDRAAEELPV